MQQSPHGFTIVELLIAIVIIAILSTMGIVSYRGLQSKARDTSNDVNISNLVKAADVHYAAEGQYPQIERRTDHVSDSSGWSPWTIFRWNTSTTLLASDSYRNAHVPDWFPGSTLVLNVGNTIQDTPFDTWQMTMEVYPVPNGFTSWDEYYDEGDLLFASWMDENNLTSDDIYGAEGDVYVQAFAEQYPQFGCLIYWDSDHCGSTWGNQEIKKEWMYFATPLASESELETCYNGWLASQRITGYRISYYQEQSNEWHSRDIGSGVVGKFRMCPV